MPLDHPTRSDEMSLTPRWRWSNRPRSRRAVWVACVVGALLVLLLPYGMPVRPSLSISYCMGFNNRGCLGLLLLFLLWLTWWYGPVAAEPEVSADERVGKVAEEERRLGVRPLGAALLVTLVTELGVWWYAARFGPMQEALYLMDRLRHLAAGERVYRDFELIYGAGFLYVPLWLSHLFHGSLLHGYFAALLLESLAGVVLLWAVVRTVARGSRRATMIFALLFVSVWSWSLLFAEQYTPLRFSLTAGVALLAYSLVFERQRPWWGLGALLAGMVVVLLVSPEQAFVLLGGTGVLAVCFLPWRSRLWWGVGLFVAGSVVILKVAARTEVFRTFQAMAGGSYSMPVTPSVHFVVVSGLLLVATGIFVEAIRRRSGPTRELYLLALSLFLLPAAFGRFDVVHVIGNTMPAALVAWCALARRDDLWRTAVRWYAVAVFVIPGPVIAHWAWELARHAREVRSGETVSMGLVDREALPVVYSPFGAVEESKGRPLFVTQVGRFYGIEDLIDKRQIEQKVEELRAHQDGPVLVLPHTCEWAPGRLETLIFTLGIYARKATREAHELQPVCDEFNRDYAPTEVPGMPAGMHFARRR